MKKYIYIVIIIIIGVFLSTEAKCQESTMVYTLENVKLQKIIKKIIEKEKKQKYYDSNLTFSLIWNAADSLKWNKTYDLIMIASNGEGIWCEWDNASFSFYQDGHQFLVYTQDSIPDDIFDPTSQKTTFTCLPDQSEIKEDGRILIDIRLTQSCSYWYYKYKKSKFSLVQEQLYSR